MESVCFRVIGWVERGLPKDPGETPSRYTYESIIRLMDDYSRGLEGLEEYSHAIIVYWLHEAREARVKTRPWGDEGLPEVGVFATRSPNRPNPIGVTVVEIVGVEPPRLRVRGLDAWTGTPVLDVKPYDYYDVVKRPRVPWWFEKRWSRSYAEKRYDLLAPWLGPCG